MGVNGGSSALNRLLQSTAAIHDRSIPIQAKSATNSILSLLDAGRLKKAVSILFASPFPFTLPLYGRLFQLCSSNRAIVEARKVESHLITYYDPPPTFLLNRAIEAYGKCGCLRDARELFDEMPQRDGGSWNALITASAHGGAPREALSLFLEMNNSGVSPTEVTFASVLGSCAALLELDFSRMVHGLIVKQGHGKNVILGSSLVDIYGKCDIMSDAQKMFYEIQSPNDVSWNVIVRRHLEMGDCREAVYMFSQAIRAGVMPLTYTISNALVACSDMYAFMEGIQIHGIAIKINYEHDETVATSLIDMYVKCNDLSSAWKIFSQSENNDVISWTSMVSGFASSGRTNEARELFDNMPERNIISWNSVLAGYVHFGHWEEAMSFILLMCKEISDIDCTTLSLMLNVSAALSDVEFGKQLHAYIYRQGLDSDTFVSNSLLGMYGKCGTLRSARLWFCQMGAWRDTRSWNSLMAAFGRHQMSEAVMMLFPEMLQETTPNEHTFATVLAACADIFAIKLGKEIHGFIVRNGYEIDNVVLGAMLDMYSKCKHVEYALRVLKSAAPGDVIMWNSMMNGCCHHGMAFEALELFRMMKKSGVQADHVTFQVLFSACIRGGFVDEAKQYFDAMSAEYCVMVRLEHYECMIELYSQQGAMDELEKLIRSLPFDPTISMLTRIVDACREHGSSILAKWANAKLNRLNSPDSDHFEMTPVTLPVNLLPAFLCSQSCSSLVLCERIEEDVNNQFMLLVVQNRLSAGKLLRDGSLDKGIFFSVAIRNGQLLISSIVALLFMSMRAFLFLGCAPLKSQTRTAMEHQFGNQKRNDKVLQIEAKIKPITTQLEAVVKSKKIRSYRSISSDEIFEKWDKGLCELCDETYFAGHKCKKMGPNYLIVWVDEEENTTEYNSKANNHSSVNKLQVFDKSPKRNTCIKSNEWLGEGKQNLQEDSTVIPCEQLSHLNPLNGLLMKTTSVAHDELASKAQHEQQLNVQQLFDAIPKRIGVDVTGHESVVHVTGVLDHKLHNNPYSQITQKGKLTHPNLLTSLQSAVEHVKGTCKEKTSEQEVLFDCKELFSLNRNRIGMIEKSIRMDEEEQNLNIQQVFDELPKKNSVKKLFHQQEIDEY
ncbi:hypothetical protein Cgig2_005971 [Carnegiea gigantea]|uniref:Pentatricopeptide repeat-containing protein n=1 Tax=Carnegiea gigantea TaxID=171969 RepID=A0A9Q1QJT0_9CARY|nr:hypothetical protein Cgig2_005971 [Carnegiea gigantea]